MPLLHKIAISTVRSQTYFNRNRQQQYPRTPKQEKKITGKNVKKDGEDRKTEKK